MRQYSQFKVRLEPQLANWIRKQAADNRRSLNGEIVYRLEQTRKQQPRQESQK